LEEKYVQIVDRKCSSYIMLQHGRRKEENLPVWLFPSDAGRPEYESNIYI
jgi:hypothetical protein